MLRVVPVSGKNVSKNAAPDSPAPESLPFEEALRKLESVVEEMETGELPLETLLARFEEGTRLLRSCQARLEDAELRIQKLEKSVSGETVLKPLTPTPDE